MDNTQNFSLHYFANSDRYQYTECDVLLKTGRQDEIAIFEYFFRKTEDGSFAVVCGIESVINIIKAFNDATYDEKKKLFEDIIYEKDLLEYLCNLKFTGNVFAMMEGELCFPSESVLVIEAPIIIAKLLETPILNAMNFQMAIASKASRISRSAMDKTVMAFGTRRAHGLDAGIYGTKAAFIAGCKSHSNLLLEKYYGIPSIGTMSHSFIQSYGCSIESEKLAFIDFINVRKVNHNALVLLIDTYDVLNIGIKNAIEAFKICGIDNNYAGFFGIRLDSGDLAYLSKKVRKLLDENNLTKANIFLTNSLDENSIQSLIDQNAKFDMIGVGDAIATSRDNPCFGGVYKLVEIENEAVIKVSEDMIKTLNPARKEVFRIYNLQGEAMGDLITLYANDLDKNKLLAMEEITIYSEFNEMLKTTFKKGEYSVRNLLKKMVINGVVTEDAISLSDLRKSQQFYFDNLSSFSEERKRLTNPHKYKIDLSTDLLNLKNILIKKIKR